MEQPLFDRSKAAAGTRVTLLELLHDSWRLVPFL
jgi:hypothetical protein